MLVNSFKAPTLNQLY